MEREVKIDTSACRTCIKKMKKIISVMVIFSILLTLGSGLFAEDTAQKKAFSGKADYAQMDSGNITDSMRLKQRFTLSTVDVGNVAYKNWDNWENFDIPTKVKYISATRTKGESIEYYPHTRVGGYTVRVMMYKPMGVEVDDQVTVDVVADGKIHTQIMDFNSTEDDWYEIGTYEFSGNGDELVRYTKTSNNDLPVPSYLVRFDMYYNTNTRAYTQEEKTQKIPLGFTNSGTLQPSEADGYNGYAKAKLLSKGAKVTYHPGTLSNKSYRLYAYMPQDIDDRSKNAKYQIYHNDKVDTIAVDQSEQYSVTSEISIDNWVELGLFDFAGSGNEFVTLVNEDGTENVVADAFKFEELAFDGTVLYSTIVNPTPHDGEPLDQADITPEQKANSATIPVGLSPFDEKLLGSSRFAGVSHYGRALYLKGIDTGIFDTFTWNPCIIESGDYNVYYYSYYKLKQDAPVQIFHNGKQDEYVVKADDINAMAKDDGQTNVWHFIGQYDFAGTSADEYFEFDVLERLNAMKLEKVYGDNAIIKQTLVTTHPYFEHKIMDDTRNHWAKDANSVMTTKDFVQGRGENIFDPDGLMTRAEYAALLIRLLNLEKNPDLATYDDIAENSWYRGYIGAAKDAGLFYGIPVTNNQILPNEPITRENAAQMISNAWDISGRYTNVSNFFDKPAQEVLSAFSDTSSVSDWALDGYAKTVKAQVINGYPDQTLKPQNTATRAEATIMLKNFLDIGINSGPPLDKDWKMTWNDEFDENNLDWNQWTTEASVRFEGLSSRWPENVKVNNGILYLNNVVDHRENAPFTAASITSKYEQTKGFFESRYKYPKAYASHTSFWTIPSLKTYDFNFNEGTYPNWVSNNNYFLDNSLVPNIRREGEVTAARANDWFAEDDLSYDFHTYSGYAEDDYIAYGFDGEWTHKVDNYQQYYKQNSKIEEKPGLYPYSMILSTVVTNFDGPIYKNSIDGTAAAFDWVRTYSIEAFAPKVQKVDSSENGFVLIFSKQMDESTINKDTVRITGADEQQITDFEIKQISPMKYAVIHSGSNCKVTLRMGITDRLGNSLENTQEFSV